MGSLRQPLEFSARSPGANRNLVRRRPLPNINNGTRVPNVVPLHDTEQKFAAGAALSHHRDAERDVAWLLDHMAERDARIEELEPRLQSRGAARTQALIASV